MNPLAQLAESLAADNQSSEASQFDEELESRIYGTPEGTIDQREAYRYPAMIGQNVAVLRRRGHLSNATLLEESAGGFRVAVSDDFRVQPEERIQVGVHSGWYEVRVAHLQLDGSTVVLGLERTGIVATTKPRRTNGENIVAPNTSTTTSKIVSAAMLTLVAGAAIFCFLLLTVKNIQLPSLSVPTSKQATPANAPEVDLEHPNDHIERMYASIANFGQKSYRDDLNLTAEQRMQIEKLMSQTSQRLTIAQQKFKDGPAAIWESECEVILVESLDIIALILTTEQLERWRVMLANHFSSGTS